MAGKALAHVGAAAYVKRFNRLRGYYLPAGFYRPFVLLWLGVAVKIIQGDCRRALKRLPEKHFYCCVTSPPYFGLRDYGNAAQIGLEQTPQEYVKQLVEVFREVRRVLRDDGTLWLNLGDSYAGSGKGRNADGTHSKGGKQDTNVGSNEGRLVKTSTQGLKAKDLIGIPWRVAFALQEDGWYLRQDIIWHKPNPMPESVIDRCTKAHEYIFLLAKSPRYYFDQQAIKEPVKADWGTRDRTNGKYHKEGSGLTPHSGLSANYTTANKRSVWVVPPKPFKGAHFATFPPELIKPCVLAGAPQDGAVLDPFCGSGTVGVVCKQLQRIATLIELNPQYVSLARQRIKEGA